ncbi:MAG: hypothetical protein ACRED5_11160 [Propylenella sp.]
MARPARASEEEREKRRLEAIAGALGAALALGTIGIIAWEAVSGDSAPPVLVVEALGVRPSDDGFLLEVRVSNRGDETAAQAVIEGTLSEDGQVVETSEATFDYVAEGSTRRGGLFFAKDPRTFEIALRAKGYARP